MRTRAVACTAVILLATAVPGLAQDRVRLELRPGVAFALKDFGDADLGTGLGIEGSVAYRFLEHLSAYGGWSWYRFPSDQSFAGTERDFEETGYSFGLRFEQPLTGESGGVLFRVQAGGTYNHVEVESATGNITFDSGHTLGWDVGAGFAIPLGGRWRIAPGVRYRSLAPDFDNAPPGLRTRLRYLALELGVSVGL